MTPVERAQAAHMATLRRVTGKRATYARGSLSVSVVVVPARTDAELVDESNLSTRVSADDWLVEVADLVLNGHRIQPASRDAITIEDAVYSVVEIPPEGAYRFTNQSRTTFRIHSRQTT